MPRPGSTTERGYGWQHQQLRDEWKPKVDAGTVACARCRQRIAPGSPWQLGHTDDRSGYQGPEHRYCNESAGGRKGAEVVNARRSGLRHSRVWFPDDETP